MANWALQAGLGFLDPWSWIWGVWGLCCEHGLLQWYGAGLSHCPEH